ncbi:unnamed protein product [Polarella glacialis]|uniref:Uncharacterized protein n=1 Tax=Polarella glacialis TaxID=89957 RepID=A0A813JFP5_POLGL|nr:unnamed protein product [Polarella glacialis]CAE8678913.1 unnamed protein product [Polarella glacialis]
MQHLLWMEQLLLSLYHGVLWLLLVLNVSMFARFTYLLSATVNSASLSSFSGYVRLCLVGSIAFLTLTLQASCVAQQRLCGHNKKLKVKLNDYPSRVMMKSTWPTLDESAKLVRKTYTLHAVSDTQQCSSSQTRPQLVINQNSSVESGNLDYELCNTCFGWNSCC